MVHAYFVLFDLLTINNIRWFACKLNANLVQWVNCTLEQCTTSQKKLRFRLESFRFRRRYMFCLSGRIIIQLSLNYFVPIESFRIQQHSVFFIFFFSKLLIHTHSIFLIGLDKYMKTTRAFHRQSFDRVSINI